MVEPTLLIRSIDSHTGGEPTRVVLEGSILVEGETMLDRREDFRNRFDSIRSGLINEPRGSEVLVGALLTPPTSSDAIAGLIFFNSVGYLGMCGHGTIGVVETLKFLNRITPGTHLFDTPAGTISAKLLENGEVTLQNIVSYRFRAGVELKVDGVGLVIGDIAYGGNWFFVVHQPSFEINLESREDLTRVCKAIHRKLIADGFQGANGDEIDHVELAGASANRAANSRNFVMCPGGAYDRSPCGTGTSAKMACLYADGKLRAGDLYGQESVTGSIFMGSVHPVEGGVVPTIRGRAHIVGETVHHFSPEDPIRWGLPV